MAAWGTADSAVAKRLKLGGIVATALAILVAGGLYLRSHGTKTTATPLTEKDTVVLADFTNSTGDPVFDGTSEAGARRGFGAVSFSQHSFRQQSGETLKLMGGTASEHITPEIATELCLRTGSKAVVSGSITNLGSQYVVTLDAIACNGGDSLAKEHAVAANKEGVLKALDTFDYRLARTAWRVARFGAEI